MLYSTSPFKSKQAIYISEQTSFERMLDYEERAQIECFETEDALEGILAFEEKRPPRFKGA